jgi:integrase/recombinase XerC/integrase/recombinase XerD
VLQYAAYLTAARAFGPTHHAIAVLSGMMGLSATEMAMLAAESFATVRGCATLMVISKGDKPPPGRCCKPRSGASMDRRSVHRYLASTARVAGIRRPIPMR